MSKIAEALVYAATYINVRPEDADESDDVGALESIAAILSEASASELDLIAAAAKRAYSEEAAGSNRKDFIESFAAWMEEMVGEDWNGNERA